MSLDDELLDYFQKKKKEDRFKKKFVSFFTTATTTSILYAAICSFLKLLNVYETSWFFIFLPFIVSIFLFFTALYLVKFIRSI